jgi:hypothetical protein
MTTSVPATPARAEVKSHGAVVLAAYRPNPELFAAQLRSIRDQTHEDFICLIGADGEPESVQCLVREAVADDPRFTVIGWEQNVGFYLNFERLLDAVPAECDWIALSDHDDVWRADKLARLLPMLSKKILVTGQARVVSAAPPGQVLIARTDRRIVKPMDLLLHNQVSGALCVFRRQLLEVALPFPRLHTVTQLHDHWLGMCAEALGGYAVLDEVVQDYVQHGENLVGEVGAKPLRFTPGQMARRWTELADFYEGSRSPTSILQVSQKLSFGWRRLVVCTIARRTANARMQALNASLVGRRRALRLTAKAFLSPNVATGTALTLLAGLPGELLLGSDDPSRVSCVQSHATE